MKKVLPLEKKTKKYYKQKEIFLTVVGVLFLLVGIIGIITNIIVKTPHSLIWFCNHASLILGFAFIFRSSFWITAELNIGFFPQLFWSIDVLSKLIFNRFVFGFTDYMFFPHQNKVLYIISWNHIFMLPITLIALYFIGQPSKNAWKGSFIHGVLLISMSYIFANGMNLNCMHESCLFFIPTNMAYKILWPLFALIIMIIPTNLLLCWAYKKIKTKRMIEK